MTKRRAYFLVGIAVLSTLVTGASLEDNLVQNIISPIVSILIPSSTTVSTSTSTTKPIFSFSNATTSSSPLSVIPSSTTVSTSTSTTKPIFSFSNATLASSPVTIIPSSNTISTSIFTPFPPMSSLTISPQSSVQSGSSFSNPTVPILSSSIISPQSSVQSGSSFSNPTVPILSSSIISPQSSTLVGNVIQGKTTISNSLTSFTFDPSTNINTITIPSSNALLTNIVIPFTVTNPKIDYGQILSTESNGDKSVIIDNSLSISSHTTNANLDVFIPSGIKIRGSSNWAGIMNLPTPMAKNMIDVSTIGASSIVSSVIELGYNDVQLTFDKPVRIVFHDKGDQSIAFQRNGVDTVISTYCNSDDSASVISQLGNTGECKITIGNDLVIWTFHFTTFFTYSSTSTTNTPSTPSSTVNSGSGGGGGGGWDESSSGLELGSGFSNVRIYQISWDLLKDHKVQVVVTKGDGIFVLIRSSISGIYPAQLSIEQPYLDKSVFEAPLSSNEKYFEVELEYLSGPKHVIIKQEVLITGPTGMIVNSQSQYVQNTVTGISQNTNSTSTAIPEFGPIIGMITLIAIIGSITISRKFLHPN